VVVGVLVTAGLAIVSAELGAAVTLADITGANASKLKRFAVAR